MSTMSDVQLEEDSMNIEKSMILCEKHYVYGVCVRCAIDSAWDVKSVQEIKVGE